MRGIVGLFAFGVIATGVMIYFTKQMGEDQGVPIAMAFGEPGGGEMEYHVVVALGMKTAESPRLLPQGGLNWDEWVDEHFDLRDEAGKRLTFMRVGQSRLIPDHKAGGTPEFYLRTSVKPGSKYHFVYTKHVEENQKYEYAFTAPGQKSEITRVTFKPVGK